MNIAQRYLLLICVFAFTELNQCRRYGGGSNKRFTTARSVTPRRPYSTHHPTHTTHRTLSTRRITTRRPATTTGWNLPPRPGSPGDHHQVPQKIVNKYNYHYPGYVSVPVQSSYPGYYQPSTHYHYSSHDTGSTALGFFLGYGLAKLTTPTFTHQSFFDGYTPRYDHYEVHHYYHNKDSVPQNQEITSNSIIGCVGDTSTVCPGNTTALCTSNGALMCVVSATSTVPCTDNRQVNCVKSVIKCVNNTAPECKNSSQNSTTSISIPCVSNAKIYGDLKYINNTIIVNNSTNSTNSTDSPNVPAESTTTSTTPYPITTTPTKYPITTTPTLTSSTHTTAEEKNTTVQNFCVIVIALPAKRKPTEGELLFEDAGNIVTNFIEKAWGL